MSGDRFWEAVTDLSRPPVFLPDIGTFFDRDVERGRALLAAVMDTGVRHVKGELLHDPEICLPTAVQETYLGSDGRLLVENYRRLIERKAVPLPEYERLFAPVQEAGLGLCLSVYDHKGVDFAVSLGVAALKIASTNIVHAPLIRHAAATGLPLLLDTGKSTLKEIWRAVRWAREAGASRLILEYSPPAPPAPPAAHNLRALELLKEGFDGPVGLSDHHAGVEALYAATALGCRVLEKGVCPDDRHDDQDIYHALPVGRLREVLGTCATVHTLLGQPEEAFPEPAERPAARMGLVAARDLLPGEVLGAETVRFAFPTVGIPVEDWDRVANRRLVGAIAAGQPLEWKDVVSDAP